ncbi:hypothetical protein LXL04_016771 [Taraxacum kok-saghyz]
MEQDPERDKFSKAKIEEPDVRLPQAILKPDDDPLFDLCYIKIFDNTQKAQQVSDTDDTGTKLYRKVYRIRNKELVKVLGNDFESMIEIQRVSKATIGILANAESNLHGHSFLDLVGTIEDVQTAEELILDKVLKTYSSTVFPIILMPPTIYGDHIIIPLHKVAVVLGTSNSNLLWIEMESRAWIKIEPDSVPDGNEWERVVNVFGPREHVNKAILLILSIIAEPGELSAAEALDELLHQLKEPNCVELLDGESRSKSEKTTKQNRKEAYWRRLFKRKKSVYGDSRFKQKEKDKKTQRGFRRRRQGQTFLRVKSPGEGSSSQQIEGEFKVPKWSQTFGVLKSEGDKETQESGELEAGGSGVSEKEKQAEDSDEEDEDEDMEERTKEDVEESQDVVLRKRSRFGQLKPRVNMSD